MHEQKFKVKNTKEMQQLGAKLTELCNERCIIYLIGDLGAGKTTLTQGFLRKLGYKGLVKSPTYTIVEPYLVNHTEVYHFDLYRIIDIQELENIGIRDYLAKNAIFLIEWPERGAGLLPKADITCEITIIKNERNVSITKN